MEAQKEGVYRAKEERYADMEQRYRRCGTSGILLPKVSLGLWHNFGNESPYARSRETVLYAFDHGITHFDLANNYGTPAGSAEQTLGRIIREDLKRYRDEMFISTKAGYKMWEGPYGEWGSRKYLMASIDASLQRLGLPYVDLFYSHRFDPYTPMEETLDALADIIRSGKALYAGLSNWPADALRKGTAYLRSKGIGLLAYQGRLNLLQQEAIEEGITSFCAAEGIGFIAYSPLAQGLLTDRYKTDIPTDSRMAQGLFLKREHLTEEVRNRTEALRRQAAAHGRTTAQEALQWVLAQEGVTTVIAGASSPAQFAENISIIG